MFRIKTKFRIKTITASSIFQTQFRKTEHQYTTSFSKNKFVENQPAYIQAKFSASSRGSKP